MSDALTVRHVTLATVRGVVGLVPWALLLVFIVGNSTIQGEATDWADVTRVSMTGLLPLAVALGLTLCVPGLRAAWRGWSGVLMSWAVALVALVVAAWALGPFI